MAVVGQALIEQLGCLLVQRSLVALELQDVVGALIDDGFSDLLLAADGVNGHDSALHIQQLQQLGNGRDLVALGIDSQLPQHHVVGCTPGADHVDGLLAAGGVQTAPNGLAIDGDQPAFGGDGQFVDPGQEALLEGLRIEHRKDAAKGVVGGNAIGQFQEGRKPLLLAVAKLLDLGPAVGPADHRADRDGEDVAETVLLGSVHARVFQLFERAQPKPRGFNVHVDAPSSKRKVIAGEASPFQEHQAIRAQRLAQACHLLNMNDRTAPGTF